MKEKVCNKCEKSLPRTLDFFNKRNGSGDGFRNICRECNKNRSMNYYLNNKTKFNILSLEYYYDNKENVKKKNKQYRNLNKEKIKEYKTLHKEDIIKYNFLYNKKYYSENKEKIRQYVIDHREDRQKYNREYEQKHHQARSEYRKKYRLENKNKINNYFRIRRKTDIKFRICDALRSGFYKAIKFSLTKKSDHTMNIIGCTINELKIHIESKFQNGMSWDNYGKWHMDHIKPCAAFDLSNPEEQKKCFHYTNLQPLWAKDNMHKSSYYDGSYIKRRKLCQQILQ
jgi:hypothetical protein